MPEHGDERNIRVESEYTRQTFQVPGGIFTQYFPFKTESVSERWCDVCGEWVTARGIMGGLLCPKCHTPWDEKFKENENAVQ